MSSLFQQFLEGAESAFGAYFERYNKSVYASLKALSGDSVLAEDLTQEVFKNLWQRRAEFRDEDHLRNNLFFMARSYFREHRRRQKIANKAEIELSKTAVRVEEPVELDIAREEAFECLEEMMMKLPPQQKLVMELLLQRNGDTGAVAKRLQLAPQTVRNHKTKAINFLRAQLSGS